MPESFAVAVPLAAALLMAVAGMAWLALAMPVHAHQAWGEMPSPGARRVLRGLGFVALGIALVMCLRVDHASMAVLVWVMALAAGALIVALALAWHPRRLRVFAPWVRVASAAGERSGA
jgi:hypothetical protein